MATITCIKQDSDFLDRLYPDRAPVAPANPPRRRTFPALLGQIDPVRGAAAENCEPPGGTRFTGEDDESYRDTDANTEIESEVFAEFPNRTESRGRSINPFSVLDDDCTMSERLGGRAKTLVRWFARVTGLPVIGDPPAVIKCGGLRAAVESCFGEKDTLTKLSFKSIQKIEKSACDNCMPRFMAKLKEWKEARLAPVAVDSSDLERFRKAFSMNVEKGWDRRRRPFIPNGNATFAFKRKEGGNWNDEAFSDQCRTELVFSSGKPRVVTLYSSRNTRVLGPLHYSLYDSMRQRKWLLVGDPTDQHVQSLNGSSFLSFDYQSATDNIKSSYVRVAIEVLREKADYLSDEEWEALVVLSRLNLGDGIASSGQPMGSVMSFPLLCLINKTVVDLALSRLLERGEISFNEWSSHRCLVNGDDLLVREPRKTTNLKALVAEEGSKVGLVVNMEKTMSSDTEAEINSTLFVSGVRQRKFNASAIWMDPDTEDVLGFASQACSNGATFRRLVRSNARILAKQEDKHLDEIPAALQGICRKDRKIRNAITSRPENVRETEKGVISMAQRPENYNLSRDEEHKAMLEEIERVRERAIQRCSLRRAKFRTRAVPNARSFSSVLKKKRGVGQDLIPACYVRCFRNKVLDALVEEEVACLPLEPFPPGDGTRVSVILDNLRAYKLTRRSAVIQTLSTEFVSDYVSLAG